jgi:histidinol phosphatase-like PHP family hydrolase
MYLVILHPDYDKYYKIDVPYLKEKIESLLKTL